MTDISPAVFYLSLAVVLIAAELLILQLSVFWFLFFGVGALITAVISWFIPLTWLVSTSIFLVSSLAMALLLYPILRKWQAKPGPIAGNDAIGQRVVVLKTISRDKNGQVQWSGSTWNAELADGEKEIAVGEPAVIIKLEGIRLFVGRGR
ncbi:MAG: NfeD family protein [Arenicella sp.]|nr:NfeD family protein [Arenicella sp.]